MLSSGKVSPPPWTGPLPHNHTGHRTAPHTEVGHLKEHEDSNAQSTDILRTAKKAVKDEARTIVQKGREHD